MSKQSVETHWSSGLSELTGQVTCIDEVDTGGSYDFDAVAVVQDDNGYHVVSSSGCSCPSHEERAQYDCGPFTSYAEALVLVPETHRSGFKV